MLLAEVLSCGKTHITCSSSGAKRLCQKSLKFTDRILIKAAWELPEAAQVHYNEEI